MALKCEYEMTGEVNRFEGQNQDLVFTNTGALIHVAKLSGRITIFIEVREDTTRNQLREAEKLALKWRKRLLEYQGPWISGGNNELYNRLDHMQKYGSTYGELAHGLNRSFYRDLRKYARYVAAYEVVKHRFKTWDDLWNWKYPDDSNPYGLDHAKDLLTAMGVREKNAEDISLLCLQDIQDGQRDDPNNSPIDENRVKRKLRTWRASKEYRALMKIEQGEEQQGAET
jgi:hypothetical protein